MSRQPQHSPSENPRRGFASPRGLLTFALPLVMTQAVVVLNQITDLWVVGSLGQAALAAVGVAGYALMIPASLGAGLACAVRTQVGKAHGAGRFATSLRSGGCGAASGLALGLVCLALGPPLAAAYFDLLGHGATVRALEDEYFTAAVFGLVPHTVAAAAAGFFIGIKKPWRALTLAGVSVTVNLALDLLLVLGLAGFEPMGVRGAAWAGVWAGALSATVAAFLMLRERRRTPRERDASTPAPCRALLHQLWRLGLPVGLQEIIDVLTWGVALTWLVGLYGTADLAAAAVILRLLQVAYEPCQGLAVAVSARVAESIGTGDLERAQRQVRTAFALVSAYSLLLATLAILFRTPILGFFSRGDAEVISIGSVCLGVAAAFLVFDGMNIVYGEGLRGAGDNRWPLRVNAVSSVVVFLGGGMAAARWLPDAGSSLIWLADGLYLCVLGLAVRSRWTSGSWRRIELARGTPASGPGGVAPLRGYAGLGWARTPSTQPQAREPGAR